MTPNISVCLPSRKRYDALMRCIDSLLTKADQPSGVEICLRLHRDDNSTLKHLYTILTNPQVKVIIGPASKGHGNLWQDCYAIATGIWTWQFQDDGVVESMGWDTAIVSAPSMSLVLPETHRLGYSTYKNDAGCPFIAVQRHSVPLVIKEWKYAIDDNFLTEYRKAGYWTHFAPISVWHDRMVRPDGTREADDGLPPRPDGPP